MVNRATYYLVLGALLFAITLLGWSCFGQAFTKRDQAFMGVALPVAEEAPAWSPSDLGSGLKLWLKSESLTGSNGDLIGLWLDSSGNSYIATNATEAAKPYLTNNASFGSKSTLYFDTAGTFDELGLTNTALGMLRNIASCSIVGAVQLKDAATARTFFTGANNVYGANRIVAYITSGELLYIYGRRNDGDSSTGSDPSGALSLSPQIMQVDADWGNSAAYAWTNNVSVIADTSWLTDGNTADTDSANIHIGSAGGTLGWVGWIGEIIVTVPAMSAENRTNTYNYLKAKFGL